jgi:hypothetical protein
VQAAYRAFAASRIAHRDALARRTPGIGPEPAGEWAAVMQAAAALATALRPHGEARTSVE